MASGTHHGQAIAAAADDGWVLAVRPVGDSSVWSWRRAADELSPTFRSREAAVAWMKERKAPARAASLPFRRWDGFHHLCHGRSEIGGTVASMPLNQEQLVEALGLVDEMIDCNAQLHGPVDGLRREALESSLAARQAKIRSYLDASEVFVTPMERSDRLALETELINRAFQHDVVLYGTVTTSSNLIFGWRSPRGQMGPQFDEREQAIDWIAEWLAEDVD
jgi:hypothetical protein